MLELSGGRPAVIRSDTGRMILYSELEARSVQLARLLRDHGLRHGDRVAILIENDIEWFVAARGIRRSNMLFVPINWHLKPAEAEYILSNSGARGVIASASLLELVQRASHGLTPFVVQLLLGGTAPGFNDFDQALAAYPSHPLDDEREGGVLLYSSGTTGRPKGILRQPMEAPFGTLNSLDLLLRDRYRLDASTVYLSPAPLYHAAPVGWTGAVLGTGGAVVVMPSFDPEAALAAIERYHVTHAQFVPTHFVRLLRLTEDVRRRYDLSSLRVVVHAAAPCAPAVKRAMIDWLGPIIYEYYGGSERCGVTMIDSQEWLSHPGSVGRTVTGAVHIVDVETGEDLPAGEIGLVYFEDPAPFTYHGHAAKTGDVYNDQAWGTYGDMGCLDSEGYLLLADRRSDLIVSGGVNIYPQEVENVLTEHPAVADAAVIGIANDEFGKEVKAVVQLASTATAPSEAELISYCRERLASFKAPRSIEFVDALPRLPSGKLLRRELVARYDRSSS
jgi:long-chain acyl-CoA synthetase